MRQPERETTVPGRLLGGMRRLIEQRLPEKWRGRLGLVRGMFVGDAADQMRRVMTVAQHFRDYRRIDRALMYHRFAANLMLSYRL